MPKKRCYFIGNTHIDHTWLWNWTGGFDEAVASFQSVLDRMEEFPEFNFTCSTTALYRWIEESDPELFSKIKERVDEGRWQLVGGWVTQSDNNQPCGEALVRQGLYGQAYFQSRFGKVAETGYCVDSFGHNGQLPQILFQQGLTKWLHFRPDPNELELPKGPYRWRGIDGTEVIACRPPGWYCTPNEDFYERTIAQLDDCFEEHSEVLFFYGVGDHGGGPTIRDLKRIRTFVEEHPELEAIYGDIDTFYERAKDKGEAVPVVEGELQHCFRGCYSVNGLLKHLNRKSEGRLIMMEKMLSLGAMSRGFPMPKETLDRAWDQLLLNGFHDVICGTCSPESTDEAIYRYGSTLEATARVGHPVMKSITSRFDATCPEGYDRSEAFCLVNSSSWNRMEPAEVHVHRSGGIEVPSPSLLDGEGKAVDYQVVDPPFGSAGQSKTLLFNPEIPSAGASLFHLVNDPDREMSKTDLVATNTSLENRCWRLKIDPFLGTIARLEDKRNGMEFAVSGNGLADLIVLRDHSDTWGTGVRRFGEQVARFEAEEVKLIEEGPLRATFQIRLRYDDSTASLRLSLYRDLPFIEIDASIHWCERLKAVKMAFPLNITGSRLLYEIPYGAIERKPNGEEQPMQRWVQLTGDHSVGIVTDSVGGADILEDEEKTEVRLTIIRSPFFGYLSGGEVDPTVPRQITDQGIRTVKIRMVSGLDNEDLGLPEMAESLSQPLHIVYEGCQPGDTMVPFSLLQCEPKTVHLAALKSAEDGDGFIARLVETRGVETDAKLSGPDGYPAIEAQLKPFEIQSWRWQKGGDPKRCDLLERHTK